MKANTQAVFVVVAAVVAATAVVRQKSEVEQLRAEMAKLRNLPSQKPGALEGTNPPPVDADDLPRDAAQFHQLRAAITELQREQVETSGRIDQLARDLSNVLERINQRPVTRDLNQLAFNGASWVSQAISLAETSPEEAARWTASLRPGEERDRAALAVIDRWVGSDPAAAAAWAAQFSEGPLREQALSVVARQWGLRDWNVTAGWLEKLPMGPSRDAAIEAFVTSADGNDIRLALEWANRLQAPESRASRVEGTARRWLREDRAAARAWLEKAQLPAGMAQRLLIAE
jgi:hypothetical protein